MDQFIVRFNTKISIGSFLNKRYLKIENNNKVSCTSCHPFVLQSMEEKKRCCFYILPADDLNSSQDELNFCSSVHIVSEEGSYLTSNPSGEVFFENIESRNNQTSDLDKTSMKFRKWIITNRNNLITKKTVVTTDEILIKSTFGNYLKFENSQIVANSSITEDKTSFNFHKTEFLPMPDWAILRPYQSNLFMTSACSKLFINNELFFLQAGFLTRQNKPNLKFDSIKSAEDAVIEETIYCLLSSSGDFIKRRYKEDNSSYYVFENSEQFDFSFVQMVNRILPLAALHDKIKLFEELKGGMNKGLTFQAFCSGLSEIRSEFYSVLNVIENEFAMKQLDLQKFWFYLQTSFKIFQTLEKLLTAIQNEEDVSILTILYNFVSTAIDEFVKKRPIQNFKLSHAINNSPFFNNT